MSYPRRTIGHILDALRDWGIPETIAGSVTFKEETQSHTGPGRIFYGGQLFAEYKYFTGIEQPLFRWHQDGRSYSDQIVELQHDRTLKPKFRLSLGPHNNASLIVGGHQATPFLHRFFVAECLTNDTRKPGYELTKQSGAFFQGGAHEPEGKWFYIEFWRPEGALAFLDFVNDNYPINDDPAYKL